MTLDRAIRKRRNYYRNKIKRMLEDGTPLEVLSVEVAAFRKLDLELTQLRYMLEVPERFTRI